MARSASSAAACAHQRALGAVAVAAGAEHDDQPAPGVRTQGLQYGAQAVGGVGVVDVGFAAAGALADPLQPSRRALSCSSASSTAAALVAGGDAEAGGDQGVGGLEGPRQAAVAR